MTLVEAALPLPDAAPLPDIRAIITDFARLFYTERNVEAAFERHVVPDHIQHNPPGSGGLAVVGIYRLHGGKIVEHWDVLQPAPAESKNAHPMF
jgi:hypothetical protein